MKVSNRAGSKNSYDNQVDWMHDPYTPDEYYEEMEHYSGYEPYVDEDEDEDAEEAGSASDDLHSYRPSWGVVTAACLSCFVLGSFLFSGSDVSDIENRLSRLEGAVHLVASVTPLSSASARPVYIEPPFIIDRQANRVASPDAIFKKEAVSIETPATPLKPVGEAS